MNARVLLYGLAIIVLSTCFIQCDSPKKEQKSEKAKSSTPVKGKQREKPIITKDDRGNIIERQSYSYRKSDNSIRSRESFYYDYDENNNLIKDQKESYDLDGSLKYKNINYHTFNKKNELIKTIFESYDGNNNLQRKAHNEYKYNENGDKIEDLTFYEDGSIKGKIILDPGNGGELLSEEFINYNRDGTKKDHKKYYYNDYGLEKTVDLMENPE